MFDKKQSLPENNQRLRNNIAEMGGFNTPEDDPEVLAFAYNVRFNYSKSYLPNCISESQRKPQSKRSRHSMTPAEKRQAQIAS